MTSSIASGLLQGIQAPAQADIAGQFRQGQQRRQGREFNKEAEAIWEGLPGAKLANLMKLDPTKATAFANAIGIPVGLAARTKAAMGGVVMASRMLQEGVDPVVVAGFMDDQRKVMIQAGADTKFLDKGIEDLMSGDEQRILAQGDGLLRLANSFAPTKGPDQKQINVLRKNVSDVTKDLRKVDSAFRKIQKAGDKGNAAGDMSLIFSFMKILDPGSTVREGEFATAQQTTGIPGQVVNFYNRAREGTRLNKTQRKDFISQAGALFSAERESADLSIGNILQQADQDQIERQSVLGKERLLEFNDRSALSSGPVQNTGTSTVADLSALSIEELQELRARASQP